MPMPLWFGHINKRVFNPSEIKKGIRPVLTHTGRSSGIVYRTPLEAYPVDGGYIFVLMYGSRCDWAQNALAAGTAILIVDGDEINLEDPRLITKEIAWQQLPATTKTPARLLRVEEYLQMDLRRD